jgi:hypothetical protein
MFPDPMNPTCTAEQSRKIREAIFQLDCARAGASRPRAGNA